MKFAAVAAAVLSLCVACQKDEELTLDGKQWLCEYVDWSDELLPAVVDFGVTVPGKLVLAYEYNGNMEENGFVPICDYKIEPKDATSGTITLILLYEYENTETGESMTETYYEKYSYSNLTATSVTFGPIETPGIVNAGTGDTMFEPTFTINYKEPATLATTKVEITLLEEQE